MLRAQSNISNLDSNILDWNLERHKIRQKLEQPEQPTLAQDLKQKRSKL